MYGNSKIVQSAPRLFMRLGVALLIGWAWTAYGQNPVAEPGRPPARREGNSSTRDLAKHVRRAISGDKSFSGYAHRVMVIPSVQGTVTLKGRVQSTEEKRAVEAKAAQIAGTGNVNTELFVTGQAEASGAN